MGIKVFDFTADFTDFHLYILKFIIHVYVYNIITSWYIQYILCLNLYHKYDTCYTITWISLYTNYINGKNSTDYEKWLFFNKLHGAKRVSKSSISLLSFWTSFPNESIFSDPGWEFNKWFTCKPYDWGSSDQGISVGTPGICSVESSSQSYTKK